MTQKLANEIIDKYNDLDTQGLKICVSGLINQAIVDLSLILFNKAASLEIIPSIIKVNSQIDF